MAGIGDRCTAGNGGRMKAAGSSGGSSMKALRTALGSRRVILAIATLLVGTITLKVPELNAIHDELFVVIVTLALVALGSLGISVNGNGSGHGNGEMTAAPPTDEELRALVRLILIELVDEVTTERKEEVNG